MARLTNEVLGVREPTIGADERREALLRDAAAESEVRALLDEYLRYRRLAGVRGETERRSHQRAVR